MRVQQVQHVHSRFQPELVPERNSNMSKRKVYKAFVCIPGRVVNVSSTVGVRTLNQCSPALQERFRSEDITEEELAGLMQRFIDEAKKGEHKQGGWPETAYGVSKMGLTVTSSVDVMYNKSEIKQSYNDVFVFSDAVNDSSSPFVQGETKWWGNHWSIK